ncbi:MAG: flavodoxin family protein [Ruminococcus sp.]|nr:flavodoxin family protein [Ruminococcus sp.]MDE6679210.1 flavodoxin family protein [Ruminococcus sp.]
MKVLVITGSPHKKGTTAVLTEQFIKGAEEAGHEVCRFDSAFMNVHPCIACEKCHKTDTGCAFKDDMEKINPELVSADVIVFVTPIYYYGMNAQIRTVIDRFYANDASLHGNRKTALMVTMADDTMESAEGAIASFKGMANYLDWEISGMVIGVDCGDVSALEKTDYPEQAYNLGKNI